MEVIETLSKMIEQKPNLAVIDAIRISPKNKDYKTIRNHFKEYKFETIDHKEAIIITFKHGKA
jgi:hypothetical protein